MKIIINIAKSVQSIYSLLMPFRYIVVFVIAGYVGVHIVLVVMRIFICFSIGDCIVLNITLKIVDYCGRAPRKHHIVYKRLL